MTLVYKKDFKIFEKDVGQGFRLPENLDFNKCQLWMITLYMKCPFIFM